MELEMNNEGIIVTRPLLGWAAASAMNTAVILRLHYAETPEELKTAGRSVQVVCGPQQTLEIAAALTRHARRILDAPRPPGHLN